MTEKIKNNKNLSIKKQLNYFNEIKVFLNDILNENQTPYCHSLAKRVIFLLNDFEMLLLNQNQNKKDNINDEEEEEVEERFSEECEKELNEIFLIIKSIDFFYRTMMNTSWSSRIHLNLSLNEQRAIELERQLDHSLVKAIINITKSTSIKKLQTSSFLIYFKINSIIFTFAKNKNGLIIIFTAYFSPFAH